MSRNSILILAAAILGLLLILSCAILPSVAPQPAATSDPNRFSTIVAGTAAALMEQTVQANAARITPTETPYVETTPTRPATGSILTEQPDGTTYFVDAVTGLEMVIPNGWVAMRIGESEFYRAWESETSQRLGFTDKLTSLSGLDPKIVRLIALDIQEGHFQEQVTTNIILQTGHAYTMEGAIAIHLEHHRSIFTDVEVISQSTGELSPGIPAIWLETAYNGTSFSTGQETRVYEKLIYFMANEQVTSIKLETLADLRTIVAPQFDQVMAGLVFYTP
jgi:hypothetical protein